MIQKFLFGIIFIRIIDISISFFLSFFSIRNRLSNKFSGRRGSSFILVLVHFVQRSETKRKKEELIRGFREKESEICRFSPRWNDVLVVVETVVGF